VDDDANHNVAVRLTKRRILIGLLIVGVIAVAIVWLARKPIADNAIRDALAKRGIPASYTITAIGTRWQRIENVRLGDPRNPDLTADWLELRLSAGFAGLSATDVRASGVRVRGRLIDGHLTLGTLDKLRPESDGKTPFTLPDLRVSLSDVRMRIDTAYGQVGARLDGSGNLRSGFAGKLAAIAPTLGTKDCAASQATAYGDIAVNARRLRFTGPVRAASARCGGARLVGPAIALDATLNEGFDRWRGTANVEAAGIGAGEVRLASVSGKVGFNGGLRDLKATADLSAQAGRYGANRLSGLSFGGGFATGNGLRGDGIVKIDRLVPDPAFARLVSGTAQSAKGTPAGPLLVQLDRAVRGAAYGVAVVADVSLDAGTTRLSRLVATGQDRLVLQLSGGEGIRFGSRGFQANTRIGLSGGGFPTIESTLQRRADGMTLGLARIAPLSAPGSRLALAPIRFAARPSGAMLFETSATLDGPLGSGRVEALNVPVFVNIAPNGALTVNRGCTPVSFRALAISGLSLQSTTLRLCPVEGGAMLVYGDGRLRGGARIDAPRLMGRIGGTPLSLTAHKAAFMLGSNGLSLDGIHARLGPAGRVSLLDIGTLTGRIDGSAVRGRFANTSGKLANVPLLLSKGAGEWSLVNGALALKAGLTLADEPVPARFNPLVTDNAVLNLVDGRIIATATLREPGKGVEIVKVTIDHNLGKGTGIAALDVPGITFGKQLQPEDLTRLTLGVIANVKGSVAGRGDIRWTPEGVTSTGRFATPNMDFAAAFGPVAGLKGAVNFSDLLALATPPGQSVTIASVNPGTLVTDGTIRYQLRPGQRIAVEGGYWPFAGGTLTLDPTVLDMGKPSDRRLTFRIDALDAARFIQTLEFENLAATGTFDGVLPMIFDETGGRIEDGRLTARAPGGTLAYVGEVSNAQMNVFAKLAFDALKSMRFQNLNIDLNGPLDGEIVSRVNFSGRNEAPLSPPKSFIARQFIGLPFKFNVTIRAPFRSLLNTARTFQDPTSLLQRTIPEIREKPVQTPESEPKR
jgi:translocation and assembly module TamB